MMVFSSHTIPVPWRLLITPEKSAAYNMAVDEVLFNACRHRQSPPTIRLYSWNPAAVSIGYGQNADTEVDPDQCRKYGIQIVRRQTGGRAVLHDEELTYSIVIPENHPLTAGPGYGLYHRVGEILINALAGLAVQGSMMGRQAERGTLDGACFSQTARYEITVLGRKIVGSAQKRAGQHLLQQGSVLLGPGHKRLPVLLPVGAHHRRASMIQTLNMRTISLAEILDRPVHFAELAGQMVRAFSEQPSLTLDSGTLSEDECREVDVLMQTKYGRLEWTFHRKTDHVV